MTQATTIKGGKVRVLLDPGETGSYAAPCGFTGKTVTISAGGEDTTIPDCDDPDAVPWLGRDKTSLSISISGEGVLAAESVDTWLDAVESEDSVPAKVEIEFPASTKTYTGRMSVESLEAAAPNGRRVTSNISMRSDGVMVRTST